MILVDGVEIDFDELFGCLASLGDYAFLYNLTFSVCDIPVWMEVK